MIGRHIATLCALMCSSGAVAQANPAGRAPSPVSTFLAAADKNDFEAMLPLIQGKVGARDGQQISARDFLKKIESCYLRRVYKDDVDGAIIATWMCAEGATASRVEIAQVNDAAPGVALVLRLEQRNPRPAPARSGSAFASEPN